MTSVMPRKTRVPAVPQALDLDKLKRKLQKAKTSLILSHPFFGTLALNMPSELSSAIPTACTNGKRVLFNPEFVDELTDEELTFLMAHEICHPMFEHHLTRNGRDPRTWNEAGDYVINQILSDERIGKMPEGGLLSRDLYDAGGGITDSIYNILHQERKGGGGGGGNNPGDGDGDYVGTSLDVCEDATGTPAELEEQAADTRVMVAQAAQAARMMGKLSAGLERLVSSVLQPKVNWREVLMQFIEKCRNDERTWARPNRRFVAHGLYLPSASGEQMGELLFAVDCSGSISADEINQFAAEIRAVKEQCSPRQIHVVYFDSEVSHYESYGPDDALDIKPHGGGGTAFSPVFKYMTEHNIEPLAVVFLTDLCCSDFGTAPECPVLWVSTHSNSAPFGEIVMMK